jgi:pyridoxamine 5'-phosphate oxidase family protein
VSRLFPPRVAPATRSSEARSAVVGKHERRRAVAGDMSTFTDAERRFLDEQPLGRIATANPDAEPDVAPVTFRLDGDEIVVAGMDNPRTLKFRNVTRTGRAAFVVDDLASVEPWRPRGIKLRGAARTEGDGRAAVIRIRPETVWSWGLNEGAATYFGPVEKRVVG